MEMLNLEKLAGLAAEGAGKFLILVNVTNEDSYLRYYKIFGSFGELPKQLLENLTFAISFDTQYEAEHAFAKMTIDMMNDDFVKGELMLAYVDGGVVHWETANIPFYHGAVMYHLMELLYSKEVGQTRNGWVDAYQWVIDNYKQGHNLSQYMYDLD